MVSTSENLLNIKIPIEIAQNHKLGVLLKNSDSGDLMSKGLTHTAKLLVEALIEGHLTESAEAQP